MHHAIRAGTVADLDEGRQRDHLATVVAHLQLADLVGRQAKLLLGLDVDLIGATKTVEVVGIQRAEIDLHGVEDLIDSHPVGLSFLPVDVGIDLRHVDLIAGKQPG